MNKIPKFVLFKLLNIFEKHGCKTIEDIRNIINKDLKNNNDIVFQWKVGE